MCTRLHAIGFPCEMDRQTAQFVADAALTCKRRVPAMGGEYRVWQSRAGAELWLHYPSRRLFRRARAVSEEKPFDPIGDLMGMTIWHAGRSRVPMTVDGIVPVKARNPLEHVCVAELHGSAKGLSQLMLSFELVGGRPSVPLRRHDIVVGLTALAQKAWGYDSEIEYLRATPGHRLIGKGAMVDVGPGDVPDVPLIYRPLPGTLWLVCGEVVRTARLRNEVTGDPYYWMQLVTERGDMDLVVNPDNVEGDISVGHTVQAVASLSGRILEGAQA